MIRWYSSPGNYWSGSYILGIRVWAHTGVCGWYGVARGLVRRPVLPELAVPWQVSPITAWLKPMLQRKEDPPLPWPRCQDHPLVPQCWA